jgi:hypothetical protein
MLKIPNDPSPIFGRLAATGRSYEDALGIAGSWVQLVAKNSAMVDAAKYGRLCAKALPKVIANDQVFDRMSAQPEALSYGGDPTPEGEALVEMLARLVEDCDSGKAHIRKLAEFLSVLADLSLRAARCRRAGTEMQAARCPSPVAYYESEAA